MGIKDNPNVYDFGLEFNYGLWTQGTRVSMFNVPWNNDYRDIVQFGSRAALDSYLDGIENAAAVIDQMSQLKPNQPIRIPIPFNAAYKYNYLRATSPAQPVNGDVARTYYYFITDVRYIAPGTTEIVVQLDVWQTFGFDATFGNCYVERGHIGIANTKAFDNYGRDYLTIPEGIDVGGEYQIAAHKNKRVMSYDMNEQPDINTATKFDILIVSTVNLLADPGDVKNPTPPEASSGGNFFSLPSGANYYVFDGSQNNFQLFMDVLKNYPWISQGIVSITAIPPIKRYLPNFTFTAGGALPTPAPTSILPALVHQLYTNWRDDAAIVNNIPARYRGLKKLFTFPYMVVQLTMFTGTPVMLKPEDWADDHGTVVERISPVPPNQRIAVSPYKYNAIPGTPTDPAVPGLPNSGYGDDGGEHMDVATMMANFPTFAIVNNMAISYLANNAHGIAFQYQNADWSQQRALETNRVGYDQASSGMNLANELTGIGVNRDTAGVGISNDFAVQKAVVNGIASVVGGAASGAGAGGGAGAAIGAASGVGGAVMGAIGAGMDIAQSQQQLAVRNSAAMGANKAQVGNQGFVRDTNKNLADFAANGDYQNTIAGINAKVQDARMTQPSIGGQVGGEALNIIHNNAVISMRVKMIDHAAMSVVGEYWLRYGYAVRRFAKVPASLMVMSKFTYWKLTETYITSSTMPETFKQVLRGILEKGVTVWANPADIGNIDIADNVPLGGITL